MIIETINEINKMLLLQKNGELKTMIDSMFYGLATFTLRSTVYLIYYFLFI